MQVDKISNVIVKRAVVIKDELAFVSESGALYRLVYNKTANIQQQTLNPYIEIKESSGIIIDVTDSWSIYDMEYHNGSLYLSTDMGMYVYYMNAKTWWKIDLPVEVFIFIRYKDTLLAFGGNKEYTIWDNVDWGNDIS